MTLYRNFHHFVFCTVLTLSLTVFAQSNFEGKVVFKISDDETATSLDADYFVKGNKMRMEMKSEEGSVAILYNQKDNAIYFIMPEQHMYMEFKGLDYMKNKMDSDDPASDADIERTGEFMKINGYDCEKWIIKEEDNTVEAWMTDELGGFFMLNNPMMDNSLDKWQQELMGNYFPMRVDIVKESEKKKVMEVISVNKMSLNDDLFSVPSGYQKFEMPNMDMYKQD